MRISIGATHQVDIDHHSAQHILGIPSERKKGGIITVMKATELVEAIDILRKAGWKVEPPVKRGTRESRVSRSKPVGRPPKNGRRKRGRPRKQDISA